MWLIIIQEFCNEFFLLSVLLFTILIQIIWYSRPPYNCQALKVLTLIGRGFWILLESGGGAPSRSPQNTVKNQNIFFAFLKVHNELGKVTNFGTSKPLFSWKNSHLKKCGLIQPPSTGLGLLFKFGYVMFIAYWWN